MIESKNIIHEITGEEEKNLRIINMSFPEIRIGKLDQVLYKKYPLYIRLHYEAYLGCINVFIRCENLSSRHDRDNERIVPAKTMVQLTRLIYIFFYYIPSFVFISSFFLYFTFKSFIIIGSIK